MITPKNDQALRKILVGISFNEKTNYLLNSAQNLAREIGASLHLFHVVDEWHKSPLRFESDAEGAEFHSSFHDFALITMRKRLKRLKDMISESIACDYSVSSGATAEEIAHAAVQVKADLLMIGVANVEEPFVGNRLTDTIDIILAAMLPVMTVNEDTKFIAHWPRQRILVANDLREQGRACLSMAFTLARQFNSGADILQINVVDPDALKAELKRNKENNGFLEAFTETIVQDRSETLKDHMISVCGHESLIQGSYDDEVIFDCVPLGISHAANAFVSDIIIFGHHELYHRHPAGVGNMPLKSMLCQKRCVIIMP